MTANIRVAKPEDVPLLPDIERAAAELFQTIPDLAWVCELPLIPLGAYQTATDAGTCWVAELDSKVVGFLLAERPENDLHIRELSVSSESQKKGLGTALIAAAKTWAQKRRLRRVTLTTFRDVPWNRDYYQRQGFSIAVAPTDRLLGELLRDKAAGLPIGKRCAMELHLDSR